MDEPFSALDVLTAENLRTELMALWAGENFPTERSAWSPTTSRKPCCSPTGSIVLGANPGHIRAELRVELERPRDRRSPAFAALVDKLYGMLTGVEPGVTEPEPTEATPTSRALPNATVGGLAGLVEIVYARGGSADIPDIAAELNFEIDDLLPLVDAAALLDMLYVSSGDLELTSVGKEFTAADIQTSKQIFAAQARTRAPLVRTICKALGASSDGSLRAGFFLDLLRRGFGPEDAQQQLDTAIDWGRYAELFDYDADTDQITADPAAGVVAPATV